VICGLSAGGTARAIVYGADDRIDRYQVVEPVQQLAFDSVVGLMDASDLTPHLDGWNIDPSPTYYEWFFSTTGEPLCGDEPYRDQPVPGYCSGFMVGEDLIATAGHCITGHNDCESTAFVFDYAMLDASTPVTHVVADDVYRCTEIVARGDGGNDDWAILRTERPIVGHPPLPIRRTGAVEELPPGSELFVIGHPVGLPAKLAGDCELKDSFADYFEIDCDTYGGNSGSPVFSADSLEVQGILVRGGWEDWERDDGGECWRSAVCEGEDGCHPPYGDGWEDVTRTSQFLSWIPALLPDCGNGTCEPEESCWTCPGDCPGCLGDTLFSDDFSLGLDLWTQSGPGEWTAGPMHEGFGYPPDGSGDPVAGCSACDPESWLEVDQSFDLTTFATATLSFWRFVDSGLDAGEYLELRAWDGSGWDPLRSWVGGSGSDDNSWHYVEVDLTRFAVVTDFTFGFAGRTGDGTEYVQIDDVRLVGYAPGVGPAGQVPEGPGVPGLPLIVEEGPGDEVLLSWGDSCLASDDDYEVYEGLLGAFDTHLGRLCSTGGATTVILTPWNGSRYWLVVPRNLDVEGSAGISSHGLERPQGSGPCLPRAIGACP
jgi:hypothetical protein